MIELSLVIATYNRAEQLMITLNSVAAQSTSPAQRIRELRIRQGLSLNDTEAMTGIGVGKLERIEKGEQDILVKDVSRIATAFRVSCDYIISGKM